MPRIRIPMANLTTAQMLTSSISRTIEAARASSTGGFGSERLLSVSLIYFGSWSTRARSTRALSRMIEVRASRYDSDSLLPSPIESPILCLCFFGICQHSLHIRVVYREERPLLELPEKISQPDSANSDRRYKVQPGKTQPSRSELRRNKPEQIYEPQHDHQHRDKQEFFRMTLNVSGKQQNERQREMKDYEQNPDIPELAVQPP